MEQRIEDGRDGKTEDEQQKLTSNSGNGDICRRRDEGSKRTGEGSLGFMTRQGKSG